MRTAAIFDLDGTLISLSGERRLIPWMIFTFRMNPFKLVPYVFRSLNDGNFFSTKLYYRGEKIKKMESLASYFFSEERVKKIVFREAIKEIEKHKKEGRKLVLLTGSPEFLAKNFTFLGFDTVIGSHLEKNGKLFTGELLQYPSGEIKREIVKELAKKEGLNLEESFGFGNSTADSKFLGLLGHPVAVNPSRRLRKIAKEMGWEIRFWR